MANPPPLPPDLVEALARALATAVIKAIQRDSDAGESERTAKKTA